MKQSLFIAGTILMLAIAFVACKKTETVPPPVTTSTTPPSNLSIPISFNRGILGINPDAGCIQGPGICSFNFDANSKLMFNAEFVNSSDSPVIRIPITYYNTNVKDFEGGKIALASELLLDTAWAKTKMMAPPIWRPIRRPIIFRGGSIVFPPGDYGVTVTSTTVDIHL